MTMEINSKQLLALAAIGAAVWYFTRKSASVTAATKPAVAPAAGSGGIWDGFGVGGNLAQAMGQAAATTSPVTTQDAVYAPNKPMQVAPVVAPAPQEEVFNVGGGAASPSTQATQDPNSFWVQLGNGRGNQ